MGGGMDVLALIAVFGFFGVLIVVFAGGVLSVIASLSEFFATPDDKEFEDD